VASIATRTPFRELDAIERRLRRTLEDIGVVATLLPAADVYETEDEFVVELEVPGYEEKELSIEIADHTLKVTGKRIQTQDETGKRYQLRGRLRHQFDRRFELRSAVEAEHMSAVLENGVLEVHAPKWSKTTLHKVEISKAGRSEPRK
jgi:HSP20 family protein